MADLWTGVRMTVDIAEINGREIAAIKAGDENAADYY
jgi:hypothetical protein